MKSLFYAIHGIRTGQTDASWPDKFDGFCERLNLEAKVRTKEYDARAAPVWNTLWKNPRLARSIVNEVNELPNRPVCFVAHSNGTDVALKAIKILARRGVFTKCFVAIGSVLPPDVGSNGILALIEKGMLGSAVAYCSKRDLAIKFASWLPSLLDRVGYSSLGCKGWTSDGEPFESARVRTYWNNDFGHSTWFEAKHIDSTFQRVLSDFNS